jgi:hypothetical protein
MNDSPGSQRTILQLPRRTGATLTAARRSPRVQPATTRFVGFDGVETLIYLPASTERFLAGSTIRSPVAHVVAVLALSGSALPDRRHDPSLPPQFIRRAEYKTSGGLVGEPSSPFRPPPNVRPMPYEGLAQLGDRLRKFRVAAPPRMHGLRLCEPESFGNLSRSDQFVHVDLPAHSRTPALLHTAFGGS